MLKQIMAQPGAASRSRLTNTTTGSNLDEPDPDRNGAKPTADFTSAHTEHLPRSSAPNILAEDAVFKGRLKFSQDFVVDGTIEGEIASDGCLTVGKNGLIKGEIKAKSVTVFGKIEGNVTVTDRIDLRAEAEIIGDVAAGKLSIEEGATFIGGSSVGSHSRKPESTSEPSITEATAPESSSSQGAPSPAPSKSTSKSNADSPGNAAEKKQLTATG